MNIRINKRGTTRANIYPKTSQPLCSVISTDFLKESKIPSFITTAKKGANIYLAEI